MKGKGNACFLNINTRRELEIYLLSIDLTLGRLLVIQTPLGTSSLMKRFILISVPVISTNLNRHNSS